MALPSRHTRNCVRASVMAIARLRNLALILYKSAHLASRLRFCLCSYYNPIASTMLSEIDYGSDRRPGFERNGCASVPLLPPPLAHFLYNPSRVRGVLEACEMMVNIGKACLAPESFLGLDMTIPTEPIGSAKGHYGLRTIRTRKLISGRVRIDL